MAGGTGFEELAEGAKPPRKKKKGVLRPEVKKKFSRANRKKSLENPVIPSIQKKERKRGDP